MDLFVPLIWRSIHFFLRVSPFYSYFCVILTSVLSISMSNNKNDTMNKIIKNILKRREESNTYLTLVCRHPHSKDSPGVKMKHEKPSANTGFHQLQTQMQCLHLQLMKATVLAESSSYFIFSPGYLHYEDVHRCESGRCHSLPFFLTFSIKY